MLGRIMVAAETADVRFACRPEVAKRARDAAPETLRFDVKKAGGIAQKLAMARCPVALPAGRPTDAGASGGVGAGLGFSPAFLASLPSSDPSARNLTARLTMVLGSGAVRGARQLPLPSAFAARRLDGWSMLSTRGPDGGTGAGSGGGGGVGVGSGVAGGSRTRTVLEPLLRDVRGVNASRHLGEAVRAIVGSLGDGAAPLPTLQQAGALDDRLKETGGAIRTGGGGGSTGGSRIGRRAGGGATGSASTDGAVATTMTAAVRALQPSDGPGIRPHAALRLARVCVELYVRYRGFLPMLMEAICDAAADTVRVIEAGGGPVGPGELGCWDLEEARRRRAQRILFRMRGRGASRSEAEAAAIRFEMSEQLTPAWQVWSGAGIIGVLARIKAGLGNKKECGDLDRRAEGVGPVTGNGGGSWLGRDGAAGALHAGAGTADGDGIDCVALHAGASIVQQPSIAGDKIGTIASSKQGAGHAGKGKGKGKGKQTGQGKGKGKATASSGGGGA